MATEDDKTEGGGEGGGESRPASAGRRGTRPARGEREAGRGGAPSNRDLEAALANLPPERLASVIAIAQARAAGSGGPATPKLSTTLDRLDAEEADNVIKACDEALEHYAEARHNRETVNDEQALAAVRDASPDVVAAIITNSSYRRKPVEHSVDAVRRYLEGKHGKEAEPEPDRPAAAR